MHYTKKTLRNGLRVLLAPMRDVESTTVMIMTGTGSRYEDIHESGLAHFLEHMFFKGTQKRKTAQVISNELDAIGGEYNAFTGKDRTAYYAKVPATHSAIAIDVVSDLFLHSRLASRDIERERGAIVQEINMYRDMPSRDVYHIFDALLYGKAHPLGRETLGTKENVMAFSRRDLQCYLKRCYTARNTVVCVAGKFNAQKVLAQIRKDFADMARGEMPTCKAFTVKQECAHVAIKERDTDQTHFVLGVPGYGMHHADRHALSVASIILGGGMSSRLFTQVREKRGLAYSIHSGIEMYSDAGAFHVKAGVEHAKLTETIEVVLREMTKLMRRSVSNKELQKAKEYIKGHLLLEVETSDDVAHYLIGQEVVRGTIKKPEEIMQAIDAVTAADVRRVAQELFIPSRRNLAVIGPHENAKERLQSLLSVAY